MNPKEHYEKFDDNSDNKKHKGLKKSTNQMDFNSYSARLADRNEFSRVYSKTKKKLVKKISNY